VDKVIKANVYYNKRCIWGGGIIGALAAIAYSLAAFLGVGPALPVPTHLLVLFSAATVIVFIPTGAVTGLVIGDVGKPKNTAEPNEKLLAI
jgi:VIT1/CCC1 family predicted Fe2+/Mn2+ transporter